MTVILGVLGALGSLGIAAGIAQHLGLVSLWPSQAGLQGSDDGSLGSAGDAFGSRGSLGSGACDEQSLMPCERAQR